MDNKAFSAWVASKRASQQAAADTHKQPALTTASGYTITPEEQAQLKQELHQHQHPSNKRPRPSPPSSSPPSSSSAAKPKKTKSATAKLGYRDRVAERNDQRVREKYEQQEHIARTVDYETSKYLGGSMENTHLVKGLDFALLERVKAEQAQKQQQTQVEAQADPEQQQDQLLRQLAESAREVEEDGDEQMEDVPRFKSAMASSIFHALQRRAAARAVQLPTVLRRHTSLSRALSRLSFRCYLDARDLDARADGGLAPPMAVIGEDSQIEKPHVSGLVPESTRRAIRDLFAQIGTSKKARKRHKKRRREERLRKAKEAAAAEAAAAQAAAAAAAVKVEAEAEAAARAPPPPPDDDDDLDIFEDAGTDYVCDTRPVLETTAASLYSKQKTAPLFASAAPEPPAPTATAVRSSPPPAARQPPPPKVSRIDDDLDRLLNAPAQPEDDPRPSTKLRPLESLAADPEIGGFDDLAPSSTAQPRKRKPGPDGGRDGNRKRARAEKAKFEHDLQQVTELVQKRFSEAKQKKQQKRS